jgi:hypothetical protein
MDHLEHPSWQLWEERRSWFEDTDQRLEPKLGCCFASEQACAIAADVQAAFCAGAWIAVLVLAVAVIDAQIQEYDSVIVSDAIKHLRHRRNALVHVRPSRPAVTVDDQWAKRGTLENEARGAVRLMFEALYSDIGT